jgi:CRISPR-associated protein Cas2
VSAGPASIADLPPEWPVATPAAVTGDGVPLPAELATFPAPPRLVHADRYKYLVAYDVRDARRLARIHKRLKDWGRPVQYSIFECLLAGTEVEGMWSMVADTIDQEVDWVVLYRLSRPYDEAVRHIGVYDPDLPSSDLIIFV